jgi:hypothetical protein
LDVIRDLLMVEVHTMPGQFFCDEYGQKVVLVKWDMGMKYIDIEFGGVRLVRLEGAETLLTTGMEGAAPDGSHLSVYASRETGPVTYRVARNGQELQGLPIEHSMHPPVVELIDAMTGHSRAAGSQGGLSMDSKGRLIKDGKVVDDTVLTYAAGERKIDQGAIRNGRIWVVFYTVIATLMGLLEIGGFVFGSFMAAKSYNGQNNVPAVPVPPKPLLLVIIGVILFVLAIVLMGLWIYSTVRVYRPIPTFGWAKFTLVLSYLPVLYVLVSVGRVSVIGAIVAAIFPVAMFFFAMRALGKAAEAAGAIGFNEARKAHIG